MNLSVTGLPANVTASFAPPGVDGHDALEHPHAHRGRRGQHGDDGPHGDRHRRHPHRRRRAVAGVTSLTIVGRLGADEVVIVCAEGLAVVVFGREAATTGESSFAVNATWFVGSLAAAEPHAFHLTVDADDVPVTYLGYESIAVNLQDGVGTLADLDVDTGATGTLTGTGVKPAERAEGEVFVFARLGPNLSVPLAGFEFLGGDFELLVSTSAGLSCDCQTASGGSAEAAYASTVDTGLDAGTLATRTQVTIPDRAGAGLPCPAGDDYRWGSFGHGGADVDVAAAAGYRGFFALQASLSGGGRGVDGDRAFAPNSDFCDFAFAP